MGRERNWSSSSSGGSSAKRSKDRAATTETPPPPPPADATAAAAGCMSGVLHLFDFHQFQFSLNHQLCFKPNSSFIQDQEQQPIVHTTIKGAEAPRNSLESEEDISVTGTDKTVSSSSEIKEEDFGFPIGIRVHTKVSKELSSSESCVSPCIKTPSLVARLMGLDLLPETVLSPSSSSSSSSIHSRLNKSTTPDHHHGFESRKPLKTRHTNFMENEIRYKMCGTRSLPDTPRISSARRSDVDPRLSLQINKENQVMINEEFDYGRSSTDSNKSRKREWRLEEERSSQSPGHYARQIVKQVKESVSRRVGRDITNVVSSNISSSNYNKSNSNRSRNDCIEEEEEEAQLLKPKKSSRFNKVADSLSPSKHSMQSCSPRLRFLETKNKLALPTSQEQIPNSPKPLSKPRQVLPSRPPPPPPPPPRPPQPSKPKVSAKPKSQNIPQHQTIDKCKKASCERFAQRKDTGIIRASPTSKANLNLPADRKCKKSPLSKELSPCSISTPTSVYYSHHHQLLSSSSASKSSSQLSCPSSQTTGYGHSPDLDVHNCITTIGTTAEEFRYLSRILKCTGLDTNTQVSFTRWFSPSHALDPSIFHHLENSFSSSTHTTISGHLTHRSNRKLLFNLVDEILVNILRPYLTMKPWINSIKREKKKNNTQMTGDQLLQQLWKEICNFPSANCQILQDIDALIDKDLPDANIRMLPIFEEVESITFEIERDILDSLVHELAATAVFPRDHD